MKLRLGIAVGITRRLRLLPPWQRQPVVRCWYLTYLSLRYEYFIFGDCYGIGMFMNLSHCVVQLDQSHIGLARLITCRPAACTFANLKYPIYL